ncbi:MAG: aminotransferase class I/II-fold pyridoxal phosphate-dependent enzyme [Clostridiales bacterium]|nr:aminotransferase class I/II-fold pyridoxal phosphate-dependent enzyme [Clostridiales bacterium]
MERPMFRMLRRGARRVSLHMPATGGRAPFKRFDPYGLDTTELAVTDDLFRSRGAIAHAQALAARSAGAARSFMLHGGSTSGIHAMLLYAARRGEEVILPRNCHISALNLCALAGFEPVFADVAYTVQGRPYTSMEAYERAMDAHPRAKAVFAVRPDYYGLMPDLRPLAKAVHARHMLLLCDEAHGATFNWRHDIQNALAQGADLVAQSAHKTLPALTPGAWLHAAGPIDMHRLLSLLPMVQTSSPSFLNLLSLDEARAWMDRYGAPACRELGEALSRFYRKARHLGYVRAQEDAPPGFAYDPLRLVLAGPQGGYALGQTLENAGIDMEMCDECCVVGILPLRGYQRPLKRLLAELQRNAEGLPLSARSASADEPKSWIPGKSMRVLPLAEATFASRELLAVGKAVGRVSAVTCGLYPPGIALVTAGEVVSEEMAEFLSRQDLGRLFGLTEEGLLPCVAGMPLMKEIEA